MMEWGDTFISDSGLAVHLQGRGEEIESLSVDDIRNGTENFKEIFVWNKESGGRHIGDPFPATCVLFEDHNLKVTVIFSAGRIYDIIIHELVNDDRVLFSLTQVDPS